jgi:dsDNA-specific endonuclease/ATPase MutS2
VAFSPLLKNLMRVLTDERTINTDGLETAQSDSELYQMIKRANPKLEQSKIINMVNSLSRAANIMQSPAASYAYQVASGLYSMIVKGLNFDGELIQKVLNTKYVSGLIDRSASFLSGS